MKPVLFNFEQVDIGIAGQAECNSFKTNNNVIIIDVGENDPEKAELIKQQILSNQEKALQFDELRRTLSDLEDENKRLKDSIETAKQDSKTNKEIVQRLKDRQVKLQALYKSLYNKRSEILKEIGENEVMSKQLLVKIDSCGKLDDEMQPIRKELVYIESILEKQA